MIKKFLTDLTHIFWGILTVWGMQDYISPKLTISVTIFLIFLGYEARQGGKQTEDYVEYLIGLVLGFVWF